MFYNILLLLMLLAFLAAFTLGLHYALNVIISFSSGIVVPMPSNGNALEALARLIERHKPREDFAFLDLGASNGRITHFVARRFPRARVVGIEKNPWMHFLGLARRKFLGLGNVRSIRGDIFKADLGKLAPDIVYMYLTVRFTQRAAEKLMRELAPGTLVICNKFQPSGLRLIDEASFKNLMNGPLRAYAV
ncbi:MAG: class I SAM-dependent methyltransferase [Rickettsiales bacterium]|jgi:trans-aconitate methyltransferase|nr:class I SAM-dependent methyltransferase [Rickettsiales bacterium]